MRSRRRLRTAVALTAGFIAAELMLAAGAFAHVTVTAPGVSAGQADAQISFRVPDESDSASTVGLTLQLPTKSPLVGLLVAPTPGWSAKVVRSKLAKPIKTDDGVITDVVSRIDWRADENSGIKPGFFGLFTIIAGQLPEGADSITFKAIQTYSDGTKVSWIEVSAPGSTAEPEHPAPVLHLAAASEPATSAGPSSPPAAATARGSATSNSDSIAVTGIVIACVAAALGAAALALSLRSRRAARR